MTTRIPVYAPNLSKDSFISLLYLQVPDDDNHIHLTMLRAEGSKFRAPEFEARIDHGTPELQGRLLRGLFEVGRSLGGTQFVFREAEEGSEQRLMANASETTVETILADLAGRRLAVVEIY